MKRLLLLIVTLVLLVIGLLSGGIAVLGDSDVDVTVDVTILRGDATGDTTVDIADAMFIAQYIVGLRPESEINVANAQDAAQDGVLDIADAMFIAQYVVGLRNADFEWIG